MKYINFIHFWFEGPFGITNDVDENMGLITPWSIAPHWASFTLFVIRIDFSHETKSNFQIEIFCHIESYCRCCHTQIICHLRNGGTMQSWHSTIISYVASYICRVRKHWLKSTLLIWNRCHRSTISWKAYRLCSSTHIALCHHHGPQCQVWFDTSSFHLPFAYYHHLFNQNNRFCFDRYYKYWRCAYKICPKITRWSSEVFRWIDKWSHLF